MDGGENMAEEDDKVLLNSLGVTSANPEDIERNILNKVRSDKSCQSGQHTDEEFQNDTKDDNPSGASKKELYTKLKAVQIEIDAVASAIEGIAARTKESNSENDDIKEDTEENKGMSNQDYSLQQALAADRLRSLKRTRSQLQKQFSDLNGDCLSKAFGDDRLLKDLVREDSKAKPKLKIGQKSISKQKRKRKVVSYDDDDGFDDVLNAASGGFIETERDELVRKGVLTPFHKLKGFERRVQQTGSSRVPMEEETNQVSASVERAARSLAEAAQARPTTKLLETNELPKLDAPAYPFQRLRPPFKFHRNPDGEEEEKGQKGKKRRPLAGKKWRKRISREEQNEIGTK